METESMFVSLGESIDRLSAAAAALERTVAWLEQHGGAVEKITAAVEGREQELLRKLEAAEQQIAELRAQSHRQTVPASTMQLLTKQGISTVDSIQAESLDAALSGLSLEQRIAVKAQLMRAGLLGR
jgi:2C-methyl-D-erythritol 2,4-cyclodiphosphate synthase